MLILIGIILMVAMCYEDGYSPSGFTVEEWEYFAGGIFLLLVTVAVGMYVSTGMTAAKYDVKSYNRECRCASATKRLKKISSAITEEKLKEKCSELCRKKGSDQRSDLRKHHVDGDGPLLGFRISQKLVAPRLDSLCGGRDSLRYCLPDC